VEKGKEKARVKALPKRIFRFFKFIIRRERSGESFLCLCRSAHDGACPKYIHA
jgi:hypothetical protein